MKIDNYKILKISLILSILVSALFAYMFFVHNRRLGFSMLIDNETIGQYGDFIGGVLGTILSVVLLYLTLNLQRKDSSMNAKIYEKQELNNEFYHLLSLYQEILKGFILHGDEIDLQGKELIAACYQDMYDGFDENDKAQRKMASKSFMQFYAQNRHFTPVYFRTLYRICETVTERNENIDFKNVDYIKILRSQLTDAELLLLRYNAQTIVGKKFRRFINQMNLLKHLPPLDLLEYKKWRKILTPFGIWEVSSLNTILIELRQRMTDLLDESNSATLNTFSEPFSSVVFALNTSENKDELTLVINRKNLVVIHDKDTFGCIQRFDKESLLDLFSFYLYDSIVLMNFSQFNDRKDLDFSSEDRSPIDNSKIVLAFVVRNTKHQRICMKMA